MATRSIAKASASGESQKTAEAQSRSVYDEGNDKVLPIAVVQPGTGKVLALAVNPGLGRNPRSVFAAAVTVSFILTTTGYAGAAWLIARAAI